MEFIPAIDLLDSSVVRLHQGRYDQITVYDSDPLAVALRFAEQGARSLHVVDLNGARSGTPAELETIASIVEHTSLRVQVGGGIRCPSSVQRWIDAGAARVVLGTLAVKDPELAKRLCEAHPDRIVIAIDARDGEVAVEGWLETTGKSAVETAKEVDRWSPAGILYTDISRDGTGEGPNVAATAALQSVVHSTVIASGGIGTLEHVRILAGAGVRQTVCGRALYEGAFALQDAIREAERV
ncbi:MAG: 1-(5-phosphoribosyl)-5-[(5-phosphoribosylamino)methylideneamino]imidazole-4-carboxamide isomerase [Myxococcota bacterium]